MNLSASPKVKFAFDFFSTGNLGDDIMLEGFRRHWPADLPCYGMVSKPQAFLLRKRFPEVDWRVPPAEDAHQVWLGVGDTPIQILSGDFFLRFLENELLTGKPGQKLRLLLGVGVEQEAVAQAHRFRKVLDKIDFIWTRDAFSRDALVKSFGVPENRVETACDLANSALQSLTASREIADRPVGLAFNYYAEKISWLAMTGIIRFLKRQSQKRKVVWLANEARAFSNSETALYGRFGFFLNNAKSASPIDIVVNSNYITQMDSMVEHYSAFETVFSCRYHCLLAAAWAGCRVVGIGRSSKIIWLCNQLEIPLIPNPPSGRDLDAAYETAQVVPLSRLNALAESSANSINSAAQLIRQAVG